MCGFRDRLKWEFEEWRTNNKRYSLRAFASFLNTDNSSLSQIFRGTRRIPSAQLRLWGRKLRITPEELAVYVAAEHVPSRQVKDRQEQLRHWTAEGLAIVSDRCHWQILELTHKRGFRADCRIIAKKVGVPVDRVNVALARLLRLRLLEIGPNGRWKDLVGSLTAADFLKLTLIRIRGLAGEKESGELSVLTERGVGVLQLRNRCKLNGEDGLYSLAKSVTYHVLVKQVFRTPFHNCPTRPMLIPAKFCLATRCHVPQAG